MKKKQKKRNLPHSIFTQNGLNSLKSKCLKVRKQEISVKFYINLKIMTTKDSALRRVHRTKNIQELASTY